MPLTSALFNCMLYWNSNPISSFLRPASCIIFWDSICAFSCSICAWPCINACPFCISNCTACCCACAFACACFCIFCCCISWSFASFLDLLIFNSWLASLMFLMSLRSIASASSIICCCNAIWMLFSSIAFSSSSGASSMNIPKSYKCSSDISSSVATLWAPIACMKASLVGEYSIISDILSDKHSAVCAVKNNPAWSICLVAVFEFAAAIFWIPTRAFLSGVLPSLASFKPVVSRIICM